MSEVGLAVRPAGAGLGAGVAIAMAASAGLSAATNYYNQPMLGVIQHDLGRTATTSLLPTFSQLGFSSGILFLLPMGDLMDRRRLILCLFALLTAALIGEALAPNAVILALFCFCAGVGASACQQIVPFAANLATPEKRGQTVGSVTAGLLCGILLSRAVAGLVVTHFGWRPMYWLSVPSVLFGAALMALFLPREAPRAAFRYPAAMGSLLTLWREEPALRRASLIQAFLFAAFSVFWTILALYLQSPTYRLGPDTAGSFGLVGAAGALAAPLAGRMADKRGPRLVMCLAAGLCVLSWVIFGLWISVIGLVVGVLALDLGVQSSLVSNQHIIYALRPDARSRINTIFVTLMFTGGAIGSAGAAAIWSVGNWQWLSVYGAGLAAVALILGLTARPRHAAQPVSG
jgi:predicted MFS family arabinose efflux permease